MELITKVKSWAAALAEVGVSLIGLGIVLEILFGGMNIPFWPNVNVTQNILGLLSNFSDQGLVGLGEVRDGASARYALLLKSRLMGENPCDVERLFRKITQ